MRQVSFWIFHILLLLGVILAVSSLLQPLSYQTHADTPRQTRVLADSSFRFTMSDPSAPDANQILEQVNVARREAGSEPLRANRELEQVAQERAQDMLDLDYYAHANPVDGSLFSDILLRDEITYQSACENLNMAFYMQTEALVDDWLRSTSGHRECLLNPTMSQAGYTTFRLPLDSGEYAYVVVAVHMQR